MPKIVFLMMNFKTQKEDVDCFSWPQIVFIFHRMKPHFCNYCVILHNLWYWISSIRLKYDINQYFVSI